MNIISLAYIRSYQTIKLLYINLYLYEIYNNYQKYLNQSVSILDSPIAIEINEIISINPEILEDRKKNNNKNKYISTLKTQDRAETGLYDSEARHYDHQMARFNSVDPIINKKEALVNPQLWNLYAYCQNNPITYLDPDGRKQSLVGNGRYVLIEFAVSLPGGINVA